MDSTNRIDTPAALVAIVVAARRARDRDLERSARKELERRFNLKLTFGRTMVRTAETPKEGSNGS